MKPPRRQLTVHLSACTGDAVVMVTLSLHVLATRWTGISLQNRKSKSRVTLMHIWRVTTCEWHAETSAGTFHLLFHGLAVVVLNKVIRGKASSAAAVSLWTDCVESYMLCKTLWHTSTIINCTVTTLNVSLPTRNTVNWVCVRLQRNVSFNWYTKVSQTTTFIYQWYLVIIIGRFEVLGLVWLTLAPTTASDWWKSQMKAQNEWTDWRLYIAADFLFFFSDSTDGDIAEIHRLLKLFRQRILTLHT